MYAAQKQFIGLFKHAVPVTVMDFQGNSKSKTPYIDL